MLRAYTLASKLSNKTVIAEDNFFTGFFDSEKTCACHRYHARLGAKNDAGHNPCGAILCQCHVGDVKARHAGEDANAQYNFQRPM